MIKYALIVKTNEGFLIAEIAKVGMFWHYDNFEQMWSDDTELAKIGDFSIVFCEITNEDEDDFNMVLISRIELNKGTAVDWIVKNKEKPVDDIPIDSILESRENGTIVYH